MGLSSRQRSRRRTGKPLTHWIVPKFAAQSTASSDLPDQVDTSASQAVAARCHATGRVLLVSECRRGRRSRWEHGTPPPSQRFSAASAMKDAGWPIRFRLDPMVPYARWRSGYRCGDPGDQSHSAGNGHAGRASGHVSEIACAGQPQRTAVMTASSITSPKSATPRDSSTGYRFQSRSNCSVYAVDEARTAHRSRALQGRPSPLAGDRDAVPGLPLPSWSCRLGSSATRRTGFHRHADVGHYEGREQTYLKHFFLEKYLERVAYVIGFSYPEFVYVDGFSGPWRAEHEALDGHVVPSSPPTC